MPPRPLVAGNWKMNGLAASIGQLKAVIAGAGDLPKVELMVCPPATLIASFAAAARGTPVLIGGQDCHALASGAYTGDISAEMLKDAGASAVIVGHSERRQYHHETHAEVRTKAEPARAPVVCVVWDPVWAIGPGLPPTPADVGEMHRAIREHLVSRCGAGGQGT